MSDLQPFPSPGRGDVSRNAASLTGLPAWAGERIPRAARAGRNIGPSAPEKEVSLVIGHEKAMSKHDRHGHRHPRGENPPDTTNRIAPPADPAGVTTAAGNAGRPVATGGAGL